MMAPEPLRSATAVVCADDTSLALPSDNKLRTGQQRVLDQVHTIKRSKSKHGKSSSSTVSPTSLTLQTSTTSTEFGGFRYSPSKTNGTFSRAASKQSSSFSNTINSRRSRSLYTKNTLGRHLSASGTAEQQVNTSRSLQGPNGLKPSRSDPALAAQFSPAPGTSMKAKGQTVTNQQTLRSRVTGHSIHSVVNGAQMTTSQTRMVRPPSVHSQTDGKMGSMKISKVTSAEMPQSATNSAANMSDMTLKEAVEFLSLDDERYKECGANYIQYMTFKEENAKQEVFQLGGIPALVAILKSPTPEVNHAVAGALRNMVFKSRENKLEVQHCGGIAKALQLLKETDSSETKGQITGLLWNLSSEDDLKAELIKTAMPALTENVLVPFTVWSEGKSNNINPDVFFNATGCLRNLSFGTTQGRKSMRACPGLIDSLVSHLQSCVRNEDPDEKSVENCVCILHNLSFQLDKESTCFNKFTTNSEASKTSSAIGCFSPKSSKAQKEVFIEAKPEESTASGVNWLCHRETMSLYLSLLDSSSSSITQEACCGALQNLTASKGMGSNVVSQILVQDLHALDHLPSLINSDTPSLQKSAMSLLNNLSRTSTVQSSIAKQLLPGLSKLLTSGPKAMGESDDTVASVCNTARTLILSDVDVSKKVINKDMVLSLVDLSENRTLPKASKAAAVLLYSLWNEKNLQGALKKKGMTKLFFVNDNTKHEYTSSLIVD